MIFLDLTPLPHPRTKKSTVTEIELLFSSISKSLVVMINSSDIKLVMATETLIYDFKPALDI